MKLSTKDLIPLPTQDYLSSAIFNETQFNYVISPTPSGHPESSDLSYAYCINLFLKKIFIVLLREYAIL